MSKEQNNEPMTSKEIQDLMRLVNKLELAEFKMKDGEFQLSIRSKHFEASHSKNIITSQAVPIHTPAILPNATHSVTPVAQEKSVPQASGDAKAEKVAEEGKYIEVKSPIVGTFYRSPSPDKPVYLKVGDTIEVGSVVCIVEAMKLFNEIESEVAGKVVKVMVEDASPVEYDQVLFLVEPVG